MLLEPRRVLVIPRVLHEALRHVVSVILGARAGGRWVAPGMARRHPQIRPRRGRRHGADGGDLVLKELLLVMLLMMLLVMLLLLLSVGIMLGTRDAHVLPLRTPWTLLGLDEGAARAARLGRVGAGGILGALVGLLPGRHGRRNPTVAVLVGFQDLLVLGATVLEPDLHLQHTEGNKR